MVLRFAEKKNFERGLKLLKQDENVVGALKACLVSFAFKKDEGLLKQLCRSADELFKKVEKKNRAELKDTVVSRTKIGPLSMGSNPTLY